jgi:hypothetical protein
MQSLCRSCVSGSVLHMLVLVFTVLVLLGRPCDGATKGIHVPITTKVLKSRYGSMSVKVVGDLTKKGQTPVIGK